MKKTSLFSALVIGMSSVISHADTFTLKDGTTVEGTVISETPEFYLLEVQVTKSIKDERKVAKADVAKMEREKPDLTAFEAISKLVPAPDFATAADYAERITSFTKFVQTYPASSKHSEAKKTLASFQAEQKEVAAGAIKYNGLMVQKADYLANAYELDARALEARIHSAVAKNNMRAALLAFSELDRDFPSTSSRTAVVPVILNVIGSHVAETKELLASLDARFKERNVGLERMALLDRKSTEAAIREEYASHEARYTSEKAAMVAWPTVTPFHKPSMVDTIQFGQKEIARLAAPPAVSGLDGGKAYRDVISAINTGTDAAAKATAIGAAIATAKAAGVPERYLAPLQASAKAKP